MRIYMDNCCFSRPFDEQEQDRVHDESNAILSIIKRDREKNVILGSEILRAEIFRLTDLDKRDKVQELYLIVDEEVKYDKGVKNRAAEIQAQANIKTMDSLHLASAEKGCADVFLTTDDRLIRSCKRLRLAFRVMNPVTYLAEVMNHV